MKTGIKKEKKEKGNVEVGKIKQWKGKISNSNHVFMLNTRLFL